MQVHDKHFYLPLAWVLLLIVVFLVPLSITFLLLPIIVAFGIYQSRFLFVYYIKNHSKLIFFQFALSVTYFFLHRNSIALLEIWSDEIIGLRIASGALSQIANQAVSTGMFPPYHYWELWYWQKVMLSFPPELMEIILRIPSMTYHAFGAIMLSLILGKVYERNRNASNTITTLIRWSVFLLYFFQPLLFQYAFEARPYSLIAFSGVVTLAILELEKTVHFSDLYIQILLSLTSFIQTIRFVFQELVNSMERKISLDRIVTLSAITILYSLLCISIRKPIQTTQLDTYNNIVQSYVVFQHMFLPGFFQFIVLLVGIGFSVHNTKRRSVIYQIVFLFVIISFVSYEFRYVAFYPRHFILTVPFILYILFSWITSPSRIIQLLGMIAVSIGFLIPWIVTSENNLVTKNFPPKVEITIKPHLKRISPRTTIGLEEDPQDSGSTDYWRYRYQIYVAQWYLERYGYIDSIRVPTRDICLYASKNLAMVITYTDSQCLADLRNIVKLDYKESIQ